MHVYLLAAKVLLFLLIIPTHIVITLWYVCVYIIPLTSTYNPSVGNCLHHIFVWTYTFLDCITSNVLSNSKTFGMHINGGDCWLLQQKPTCG